MESASYSATRTGDATKKKQANNALLYSMERKTTGLGRLKVKVI